MKTLKLFDETVKGTDFEPKHTKIGGISENKENTFGYYACDPFERRGFFVYASLRPIGSEKRVHLYNNGRRLDCYAKEETLKRAYNAVTSKENFRISLVALDEHTINIVVMDEITGIASTIGFIVTSSIPDAIAIELNCISSLTHYSSI